MRYKIITSISTHEILARFRARIAAPRGFRACAEGEGEGDQRERKREREGRAVVLHILHSADVRGGHSSFPYTRSVGKKYGGLEANGRTEGGGEGRGGSRSRVTSFILFARRRLLVVAAARLGMRARTSFDPRGPRP